MRKFGDRVRAARENLGWSQARLARELGIRQPSVHAMEHGNQRTSKYALQIAQKTGVRPEWLETGEGAMLLWNDGKDSTAPPRQHESELGFQQLLRDMPVLETSPPDADGSVEIGREPRDHVRRPMRLVGVPEAYAIYMRDDTMAPWREHGDLVFIHPHQPAKVQDYVLVMLKPESAESGPRCYIRRLISRSDDELHLLQFTPRKEQSIPADKILGVHRIIDWSELLAS